ncbi:family 43 glycosylhydrolase [Flavobacterium franklandianum]|uniref:family 43 glycosylhydrolase n=1 Tax=Flavobacterium franklandianum TaxID=2594430 RepID=UPI00117B6865|nr:family 43 glycosylhydrolase [Flavobacterium franklandianum]TRX30088.1 family 43 glycosylhydrolase [Flavobacterium franklandianum]
MKLNKLFLVLCICYFQMGMSQSFTQPIADLADPHITYVNGYYYYTGTTGGDISIKKATTLEGLKQVRLTKLFGPGNVGAQTGDYWAPELHRLDGKWYIYYTAKETGSNIQKSFVIENSTSDPMSNNWNFRGKLSSTGADYYAIDGTVLELLGNRYFFWSGIDATTNALGRDKPQRIYVSLMSNPWTLTGSRSLLSSPGELSGGNFGDVNEGPEILLKNGKVFMAYSANGCWTPDYKMGMMYMNDTANPLLLSSWTKMHDPVFVTNAATRSYGPGHNCFFKSPDGSEDWFAYHATPNSGGDCGNTRTTRAQKITFDGSGIPQFGQPSVIGEPIKAPSGEPALPIQAMANGLYKIKQKNTTKLVEIGGAVYGNPASIIQWEDNGGLGQQWWIQATGDGYYTFISALSGLAMEIGGCSVSNLASAAIWTPNGAPCQLWTITDIGSGNYSITNKNSGKALEIDAADINVNGGNVQQNASTGTDNQQFKLEFVRATLNTLNMDRSNTVKIYPNPAKEKFTITGLNNQDSIVQIKIIDIAGKTIRETNTTTTDGECKVDVSSLKSGLYFLHITTEITTIYEKIIID